MAPYSPLETALIKTLTWFSFTQHPVTTFECWRYLYTDDAPPLRVTPWDVQRSLERLVSVGCACRHEGFWWLVGADVTVEARSLHARQAITKRRRALQGARLLRLVPFVRFVGLGNTLAFGIANPDSDVDVLIVLRQGRMFLGRLLATLAVQLAGWRRHGQHVAGRICLSFYLVEPTLDLASLKYDDDPYLTFWLASLVPLFGEATYSKLAAANSWLTSALPNWRGRQLAGVASQVVHPVVFLRPWWAAALEGVVQFLGGSWGEVLARRFELALIRRHRNSRLGDGTRAVVVTNEVLKFHESDHRVELAAAFRERTGRALAAVL